MSEVVEQGIEHIVGSKRHSTDHIARAVSAEQTVYILHSQECEATVPDLRMCPFSIAMDRGIEPDEWIVDAPVLAGIFGGRLVCKGRD
jgi:hypothetical protein